MSEYFIYYASSNVVGVIIFGIMLTHDRLSIDRQEKQLKYDHALIAFMGYFLSDAIWSGVDSGVFPVNTFTVIATNVSNFVLMTAIIYTWLRYVMAVEQIENRNKLSTRIWLSVPFAVSLIALILTFLVSPRLLVDENLKNTGFFDFFLIFVPYIYLAAIIIYTIKKARSEENAIHKKRHLYVGFFPLMVVAGGLMQMLLMPTLPIFCFSCTILMLIFFVKSMDGQISTDPLTRLNNRGQLARYVAQSGNLRMEGRRTFVLMMDVNDFKKINDIYGHAEGDQALVILAQALVQTVKGYNMPMFLGRYGGDEFVMIAHPVREEEMQKIVTDIRENVKDRCERNQKAYLISVGIGYDELLGEQDTFQKCMMRADSKLYLDKEYCKINGKSTICN